MATSGYLVSPAKDPSRKKLWDETWERVNRFLPDLRNEILGEEVPEQSGEAKEDEEKQ
jgi:brefeldin A-resistance guanine nucleotide exchange factor 1